METTIQAHFDGKTFVPDQPVSLPTNTLVRVEVIAAENTDREKSKPRVGGWFKGQLPPLPEDFDDPLPDEFWLGGNP